MMYYCYGLHKPDLYGVLTPFQVINQTQCVLLPPHLTGLPEWVGVTSAATAENDFADKLLRHDYWMQVIYNLQNEKPQRVTTPTGEWYLLPIPDDYQPLVAAKQSVLINW